MPFPARRARRTPGEAGQSVCDTISARPGRLLLSVFAALAAIGAGAIIIP